MTNDECLEPHRICVCNICPCVRVQVREPVHLQATLSSAAAASQPPSSSASSSDPDGSPSSTNPDQAMTDEVVVVQDAVAGAMTIAASIQQVVHVCAAHKKPAKLLKFISKVR